MLLNKDGSFIRDIDIDELIISLGHHYGKTIVLTKEKLTYRNTIHPTIGYMSFPQGYFDIKELTITAEQFKTLSDRIHNAGLLNLLQPITEHNIYPGAVYQTMSCIFDDGAQYEYITCGTTAKEFDEIVQILLPLCNFPQDELLAQPVRKEPEITFYETFCCNITVLSNWLFCPKCGKMLDPLSRKETKKTLDFDETVWLCDKCQEGVPMKYRYCGKCGTKRNW